jgi:hypothetical protein
MMAGARLTASVLALVLAGSSQVRAMAQAPIQTQQIESRQAGQPPTGSPSPAPRAFDKYDLGAAAANVLWVPFKAGTCGITAGVGVLAFILTLGAVRSWTESAVDEGCIRNWLLIGDDFRPMSAPGVSGQASGYEDSRR